ncbi:MAG: geranylgeranyl reductase family protein [Proteobacteria bacterium]|nr:geranylgeranyl reductase family protein [Pseudomonadota bacterium]
MNGSGDCEVLVIGGGPAGATAAYTLALRGIEVVLVEKARFPRPKLCGGLLTWKTIRVLGEIFQTGPEALRSAGLIHYGSRKFAIRNTCRDLIRGELDYPFHFVDRRVYDHYWLERAARAGAEVIMGLGAVSLDAAGGEVRLEDGRRLRARFILGADGVSSRVRTALARGGYIEAARSGGLAATLETSFSRNSGADLPDYPVIAFGFIPWGYAWSFPGPARQVVGICGLRGQGRPSIRTGFDRFVRSMALSPEELPPAKSRPLPYGNFMPTPGYGNILLLGDAAGLVEPLLGEGIYYAHRSGQLAAHAVWETRRRPQTALAHYMRLLERPVYHELKYARLWRGLMYSTLSFFNYHPLALAIKAAQKAVEGTINGWRSFGWLRSIRRNFF